MMVPLDVVKLFSALTLLRYLYSIPHIGMFVNRTFDKFL